MSRPAFDDDFGLCVEFHAVPPLRVQIAEETLVPATEREKGHRSRHAHVNPDVPGIGFEAKSALYAVMKPLDSAELSEVY